MVYIYNRSIISNRPAKPVIGRIHIVLFKERFPNGIPVANQEDKPELTGVGTTPSQREIQQNTRLARAKLFAAHRNAYLPGGNRTSN